LLGNWKNIEELEESLSLEELHVVVKAARDREERHHRFMAAIKGINLDEGDAEVITAQEKVEEMKRRAEARRAGKSDEMFEFDELGLDIEVEE